MDSRSTGLSVLIIAVIAAVFAFGYGSHRNSEASSVNTARSVAEVAALPATVCYFQSIGFEGTETASMRIYKGRIRIDNVTQEGNQQYLLRLYRDADGVFHYDKMTGVSLQLGGPTNPAEAKVLENEWQCSPWWLPSEKEFQYLQNGPTPEWTVV